jgi:enoyl-CoA hydratase/carnithine racemase
VPPVRTEENDGILTVTIDRPEKKNAADNETWQLLTAAFEKAACSGTVRVVVLTGAGGEFCAGADLSDLDQSTGHPLERMRRINLAALALHRIPQPTIAKVDGVAVGAGCNLAFGCDLVVASDRARFSEIFSRRGLSLDFGGSWLLVRRVGLHKAKELAFFGDILSAEEAAAAGLVNQVVGQDELDGFVADWATTLAAGPPLALSLTKSLLHQAMGLSFAEALDQEAAAQAINIASEDGKEALAAFLERRQPTFKGR